MAGKNEAKVRFTAETTEFTQAIQDANSEMKTLSMEMKLAEAQFQNTGNESEYLQQKTQLLEAQLEANAEKQEALTQKLEVAKEIYGEDSEQVAKLERQLIYAQTQEERLKTQLNDTNEGLTEQSAAAEGAGSAVDDMAEILINAGIASAIKDMADAAYELASAFDEANAAIVEGTGETGEALRDLNESAKGAFSQIADADQDLTGVSSILATLNTRFGVTGKSAEDMTVAMANFAQHTGTEGTQAVDDIANVMQRWDMDISETDGLLDDLTTANQSCQMSVSEMTRYLSENSIQFKELEYSTEDALAMLISLSDGGANVSSIMAGMKKAVGNLSGTTKDVPGAFQDAIKAIADCDSVSEALQAQVGDTGLTVEKVFGAKAAQELAANVQSGNFNIEQWTKVLQNNQGALEQTTDDATTMEDAWSQASNNVSLALGGTLAPAVSDVVKGAADLVTKAAQAVQDSTALQAVVVSLATAFGILAVALGALAIVNVIKTMFSGFAAVLVANPIFLVITAIAALAAGLIYAYKHCETFRNGVKTVFNAIKTVVTTVINTIKNVITKGFQLISKVIKTVMTMIKTVVSTVWNAIKTVVTTVVNTIRNTVSRVFNAIKSVATSVWNAIKTAITRPVQTARTTVTNIFNAIRSTVSNVVHGIRSTVSSAFNAIKSAMTGPIQTARSTIQGIMSKIKGLFPLRIGKIFSGLQIPSISVSAGKAPFGIGGKGSLPKFHVSWHAKGVVFDVPTLFPTLAGWHGVGEAGPEAVSPISTLQEYIGAAVQKFMPQPINYALMGEVFANACAKMGITINLDKRELGRVIREVV